MGWSCPLFPETCLRLPELGLADSLAGHVSCRLSKVSNSGWLPRSGQTRGVGGGVASPSRPVPQGGGAPSTATSPAKRRSGLWRLGLCDSLASPSAGPHVAGDKRPVASLCPFSWWAKAQEAVQGAVGPLPQTILADGHGRPGLLRGGWRWPLWFSQLSKSSQPGPPRCAESVLRAGQGVRLAALASELPSHGAGAQARDRTSRSSRPPPSLPPARPGPSDRVRPWPGRSGKGGTVSGSGRVSCCPAESPSFKQTFVSWR